MRIAFTIIFSLSYLWLTAGVSLNQHFCGGKFSGIQIYTSTGSCCCGGMEDPAGCCEDKTQYFQLDIDQKIPGNTDYRFFNSETESIIVDSVNKETSTEKAAAKPITRPPPKKALPIYLLFSQFMFYG